jgi:hypothetical protein
MAYIATACCEQSTFPHRNNIMNSYVFRPRERIYAVPEMGLWLAVIWAGRQGIESCSE